LGGTGKAGRYVRRDSNVVPIRSDDRREVGNARSILAKLLESAVVDVEVRFRSNDEKLRGIADGQRTEHEPIDDAEHGGVGADAQRERQNGSGDEARQLLSFNFY
jgi:hypothetical protein